MSEFKVMTNYYIQATIEMFQSGIEADSVLKGLQRTLETKGHMRLHVAVLRGVLRILETKTDSAQAIVSVAKESDVTALAEQIKASLTTLNSEGEFTTKVDDTLIGGTVVECDSKVIDKSYKTALTNLYRATTN